MIAREKYNAKILAVTTETFYNIMGSEGTSSLRAKAFALYTFYCVEAVRQGSSQPLAVDAWCSECLRFDLKAIRTARKLLMDKGLIEHIKKKNGYRYVRIHYLPVELPNRNFWDLDKTVIKDVYSGDWPQQWLDRMLSNISVLAKKIENRIVQRKLKVKCELMPEVIRRDMTVIFERVMEILPDVNCEHAFVYYMIDSFIKEARKRQRKTSSLQNELGERHVQPAIHAIQGVKSAGENAKNQPEGVRSEIGFSKEYIEKIKFLISTKVL